VTIATNMAGDTARQHEVVVTAPQRQAETRGGSEDVQYEERCQHGGTSSKPRRHGDCASAGDRPQAQHDRTGDGRRGAEERHQEHERGHGYSSGPP